MFVSQRGSHAKYRKDSKTVIVPTPRKEIPLGTFRPIIRQSGLDAEIFTGSGKKTKKILKPALALPVCLPYVLNLGILDLQRGTRNAEDSSSNCN